MPRMMFNEKDAGTKICPMLSAALQEQFESCIGSRCMMWVWDSLELPDPIYRKRRAIHSPNGGYAKDEDEAKAVARPADVPASWTIELDEDCFDWVEPDDEFEARKAEYEATWPERRKGHCSHGRGK